MLFLFRFIACSSDNLLYILQFCLKKSGYLENKYYLDLEKFFKLEKVLDSAKFWVKHLCFVQKQNLWNVN